MHNLARLLLLTAFCLLLSAFCLLVTAYRRSLTHGLGGSLPVEGQLVEVDSDLQHGCGPSRIS